MATKSQSLELTIRNAKGLKGEILVTRCGAGLEMWVSINQSGKMLKKWVLRYTDSAGKRQKARIGSYPELTLAKAQAAAEDLKEKAKKCIATFDELNTQIKTAEKRIAEIQGLKKHIFNYAKTRDIYTDYRKAGYSKKFYEEHRADLTLHKAAKAAFEELGVKKLPTIKALQAECDELFSMKNKAYSKYHTARKEMQDILTAKANIDRLLGLEQEQKAQEKSQEQR